ncbi:unnamed protein product [Symbiodinium natans]|uniref:Uncharacterized protein n=1 Tax=Symbiodinium natans TaxID=878477 RepID=A0A812V8H4_9DINO|nr:unnamed protein product [Symbiodinium natans]
MTKARIARQSRACAQSAAGAWLAAVKGARTRRLRLSLRAWSCEISSRRWLRSSLRQWQLFWTSSRKTRLSCLLRRWRFLAKARGASRQVVAGLLRGWIEECSKTAALVRRAILRRLLLAWRIVRC